jgi:hypothetical protein
MGHQAVKGVSINGLHHGGRAVKKSPLGKGQKSYFDEQSEPIRELHFSSRRSNSRNTGFGKRRLGVMA